VLKLKKEVGSGAWTWVANVANVANVAKTVNWNVAKGANIPNACFKSCLFLM